MTRVSSFGHNQTMVSHLLQNQSRLYDMQKQVNTGKKADEFRGLAREAQTLLSAKSLKTRTDGYMSSLQDASRKLDANELYLENIRAAGDKLRQSITETLGQGSATAFTAELEQAAGVILGALNAQLDGRYIFSGSRSDTQPVSAITLADIAAAPDIASLFTNDHMKLSARVGDNVELPHGVLASEAGQEILQSIKNIVDFNNGPMGSIDGHLTDTQRSFLEGEMSTLISAIDTVQDYVSENGLRQNRVESLKGNLEKTSDFYEIFIGDIEDVNMAEALTRINADRLALEVSYNLVGQLSKLSLVNYI